MNTQYKKTLRRELANLGIRLDNDGLYYNDLHPNNFTTSRRIKAHVVRALSDFELGTLEAALGNAFGQKINVKNYQYYGPSVIVYFRR
jgi:hypothetical protein